MVALAVLCRAGHEPVAAADFVLDLKIQNPNATDLARVWVSYTDEGMTHARGRT